MRLRARKRKGFSLIDVMLATVILTVGMIATSRFFTNVYAQLIPNGEWGGLRRFVMAEAMLKAEAEGLRAIRYVPLGGVNCKLIKEPAGSRFQLGIAQSPPTSGNQTELFYFDLDMSQNGQAVGTLSLSTLRSTVVGQYEKVGL